MEFFKLRGSLTKKEKILLSIAGFLVFIGLWWAVAEASSKKIPLVETTEYLPSTLDNDSTQLAKLDSILAADSLKMLNASEYKKVYPILPTPPQVVKSFPTLLTKDDVIWHTWVSVWRNFKGYFWAVVFSIPLGFLMGLFPGFKGMFRSQVDALRYLPLTALTGLFMLWFGTTEEMKVAFLAFGIIVYLLPVVVQRIDEVEDTYLKTVFTLGAKNWQTIKSVYIPSVMSKLMDDIRVLTAISWTYIIIAEYINREDGIGGMIQLKQRFQKRPDMFGILFIIILVGFLQDRGFVYLDKRLFPHKYYKQAVQGIKEVEYALYAIASMVTLKILQEIWIPSIGDTFNNVVFIVLISSILLVVYGEIKIRRQPVA
jgi:NitT/TauT family transport system permease protein